jgi:hypothetical protein
MSHSLIYLMEEKIGHDKRWQTKYQSPKAATTSRCRSTASLLEETKENSLQFLSAGAFNLI